MLSCFIKKVISSLGNPYLSPMSLSSYLCFDFAWFLSSSSYFISMTAIVRLSKKKEHMTTQQMKYGRTITAGETSSYRFMMVVQPSMVMH